MAETAKKEHVRRFEWGTGSYAVDIHLPRPLEQLENAEEAIKRGYSPIGRPNAWPINSNKFRIQEKGDRKDDRRTIVDLKLDEIDIGYGSEAYVASGKHWSESGYGGLLSPGLYQLLISAQFYKR